MTPRQPTELGRCLVRFFTEYLPTLRGVSPHTIRSYRDALVLLLQFLARDRGLATMSQNDSVKHSV